MVKMGNGDPNRAELCESATKEWNKINRKLMILLEIT
jgi:hypothetical protein